MFLLFSALRRLASEGKKKAASGINYLVIATLAAARRSPRAAVAGCVSEVDPFGPKSAKKLYRSTRQNMVPCKKHDDETDRLRFAQGSEKPGSRYYTEVSVERTLPKIRNPSLG